MSKRIAAGVLILLCVAQVHGARRKAAAAPKGPNEVDLKALRLAVEDLTRTFPKRYPKTYLARLAAIEKATPAVQAAFQREALLANPLLDGGKILAVRRNYKSNARKEVRTCTPSINAYCLVDVNPTSHPSELVVVSDFRKAAGAKVTNIFTPPAGGTMAEIDLDFDAKKVMYSGVGSQGRWHVHEVSAEGKYLRQLTPKDAEFDSFDACYLPDGRVIFTCTAPIQGLPCEYGRRAMANTYLLDPKTSKIRRLTFDQDSNWSPSVMENGRVLYLRWEYSDTPHYFSRIVMTMNPDGTNQAQHYGSNSYWPNATYTPKQIPGSPSQFVGIVSGHHSIRPGPIVLFDTARGRFEADGAVQMIPGRGKKVEPVIADGLYGGHWPKSLNPVPLGTSQADGAGRYFLVSSKPNAQALWGVYLVDVFDNMTLIAETEGYAINEPILLEPTRRPSTVVDRVKPGMKTATVSIADIYIGPGLRGVPRGTVKQLRVMQYHFAFVHAGSHEAMGIESSWDVKRVLGTVPVAPDGSAFFTVPANTPIALQPLDKSGAAVQLMRSWFTAMGGEAVSCVGCHENPNDAPVVTRPSALRGGPVAITPWQGRARNFAFLREVQPVLDRKCIGCHDGKARKGIPNFDDMTPRTLTYPRRPTERGGPFTNSYIALAPHVRRPGPESDIHLFNPMEYHASTSPLVQMLTKGHHNVTLTPAEWEKLHAWIDMNAPFWGSWTDAHRNWGNVFHREWAHRAKSYDAHVALIKKSQALRNKYQKLYANIDEDPETDGYTIDQAIADRRGRKPVMPPKEANRPAAATLAGWPFDAATAKQKQAAAGKDSVTVATPGGAITLRRIPAGRFVMGSPAGQGDETPHVATIVKPFWMADAEVTNALYNAFDATHDSGYMDRHGKDNGSGGVSATGPHMPVIRVSFNEARAFCKWLSAKTGKRFRLPTEVEWEWAARAGTATPFYFGPADADFSKHANLADTSLKKLDKISTYNYILRNDARNDGALTQTDVKKYAPNAFGLHDMIGNVAEWTSSDYTLYGAKPHASVPMRKVTRGGGWRDIARWALVHRRVPYQGHQRVYNVGIRLVME